ncbi:MAG: methyltransferase domain-containing protein [Actinomycetota bacterium]
MDPKTLNALVHDREAEFYDDRFLIEYGTIAGEVTRELQGVLGSVPRARRALDVACGTGYLAIGIAAAGIASEVHATDLSPKMIERTRENAAETDTEVRATLADGERLPYADASFDLVVARGALHHLPAPLAGLKEIRRVLEPGGTALVMAEPTPNGERQTAAVVGVAVRALEGARTLMRRTPDLERRHWELASIAANLHTFEPHDVEALAEKAGFEDITVETSAWAWILALGLNYYLVGEFERAARLGVAKRAARAFVGAAKVFDLAVADRIVPPAWRHTVQAVVRSPSASRGTAAMFRSHGTSPPAQRPTSCSRTAPAGT